jgi:hypothetical protein
MMTHTPRRTPTADGRRRFSILLTASLVSSLIMLDPNIVAVSLPSIARSLGATFVDFTLFKQPTFLGAACATLGYAVKGFKGAGISQARHHLMNVFLGLRTFLARNEEVFLASCFLDFLTQRPQRIFQVLGAGTLRIPLLFITDCNLLMIGFTTQGLPGQVILTLLHGHGRPPVPLSDLLEFCL